MLRSCSNNKFYKNKEEKKKKFKFIQAEANFCFGRVLKIMSKALFKKKENKIKRNYQLSSFQLQWWWVEQNRKFHIHKFRLLTVSPHAVTHTAKEMHWQPWKEDGVHFKAGTVCSTARPPHLLCTVDLFFSIPVITSWKTQFHCLVFVLSINLLNVNL